MSPESPTISTVAAEVLSAAQFFTAVLILSYASRRMERWCSEVSESESDDVCARKELEMLPEVSLSPKFPSMTSTGSGATAFAFVGVISVVGAVIRRMVRSFSVSGIQAGFVG